MIHEDLIRKGLGVAISEAEEALSKGNVPIGCSIMTENGEVIATGQNEIKTTFDTTAHAEVTAFRKAGKKIISKYNPEDTFLFSSVEPCFGCGFFAIRSNIKTIAWCLSDNCFGSVESYLKIPHMKDIYGKMDLISEPIEDLKKRSSELMVEYYTRKGNDEMVENFKISGVS